MSGYLAFMGKEFKEQIRTFKALILFIVLLLFGLVSPALAKIMPELLKLIPMDGLELTINIPAPTWMDAYAQFFKNITQIGIIVLLILLNGSISQEMQRGTLINMLSKGLARPTVILAKFTASGLLWSFCYVLSAVGTWIYTLILFGKHAPSHLFFSFFCLPDFIGADALVRKTSNFAFPPPSVIQAVSAIAVLKGVALEFVVYSFHSVLLKVPSSHG